MIKSMITMQWIDIFDHFFQEWILREAEMSRFGTF